MSPAAEPDALPGVEQLLNDGEREACRRWLTDRAGYTPEEADEILDQLETP